MYILYPTLELTIHHLVLSFNTSSNLSHLLQTHCPKQALATASLLSIDTKLLIHIDVQPVYRNIMIIFTYLCDRNLNDIASIIIGETFWELHRNVDQSRPGTLHAEARQVPSAPWHAPRRNQGAAAKSRWTFQPLTRKKTVLCTTKRDLVPRELRNLNVKAWQKR